MTIDQKKLWRQILSVLQPRMREHDFLTWFQNTMIRSLDEGSGTLLLGVPSEIVRTTILAKHHSALLDAAQEVDMRIRAIEYEVASSLRDESASELVSVKRIISNKKSSDRKEQVSGRRVANKITTRSLNPKYTFDNFIIGGENRLAHAAFTAAATRPGRSYNPLFVYGGVGIGKTHLLHAVGNEMLERDRKAIVVYTTSEKFVSDLVQAFGGGIRKLEKFRERYRKVDCLIIDDIQFLAGKEKMQEEFFHTFNVLVEANKQVILSSDRQPHEIQHLDQRLVSRFASGMIVDIGEPEFETRLAILQQKCRERGALIAGDVLEYIAYNVRHSVRELEGVLTQIMARVDLMPGTAPSIEMVAEILRKTSVVKTLIESSDLLPNRIAITAEDIIKKTADYYRLKVADLVGVSRKQEVMMARQVAVFLIRNELSYSLERMGREFGGRNHATILHSYRKINTALKSSPQSALARDVATIKQRVEEGV